MICHVLELGAVKTAVRFTITYISLSSCVCVCVWARACTQSCWVVSSSVTLWTVAHQAPLSMGFPRQEYCSGLPFLSPEDLPDSGIEPASLCLLHRQADSLPLCHLGKPLVLITMLKGSSYDRYFRWENRGSENGSQITCSRSQS